MIQLHAQKNGASASSDADRQRRRPPAPGLVSRAVLRCIEERRHELWVPRRFALAYAFRLALPGVYRWASSLFDPVPREVIDAVRRRQGCDGG